MNKVTLIGRLTRDPEIKCTQGERQMAVAHYTLAVNRRGRSSGAEQQADFIRCVAFDKAAEFAEKYFRQGMRVAIAGRIQTGSYTNKDGQKVYTTEVIIEEQEFAESKSASQANAAAAEGGNVGQPMPNPGIPRPDPDSALMSIPDGIPEDDSDGTNF